MLATLAPPRYRALMDQQPLEFYVESSYLIAGVVILLFVAVSLYRARRTKRVLSALEREDA